MKEAAGEANMTVITILLIGVVAAIATPLITNLMNNSQNRACCQQAGGVLKGGKCVSTGGDYFDQQAYEDCKNGSKEGN